MLFVGVNYNGHSKHFIPVDNDEPLLVRTVRQVQSFGFMPWVVAPPDEPQYHLAGTMCSCITPDLANYDTDKFLSSEHLWSKQGRTVVLLGDVYFSDQAIKTVFDYEPREWHAFMRPYLSRLTKKPYGEFFAQSFWPEHQEAHKAALLRVRDLQHRRIALRQSTGWQQLKAMLGWPDLAIADQTTPGNRMRTIIDDFTEDFDLPRDWECWRAARGWISGTVSVG